MRIAVISKSDTRGGGASVVAGELVKAYRAIGHEADHINTTESGALHPYGAARPLVDLLKATEGWTGYRDHVPFELMPGGAKRLLDRYDAFHFHDLSTVFSAKSVAWFAARKPTLWTLHDCSPFTAGCLYPGACERFTETCGSCPKLGEWPLQTRRDRTPTLHAGRRQAIADGIRFTAPSRWMIDEFVRGGNPASQIDFVPNGVDADLFMPRDKEAMRREFGLDPVSGPLILFSAGWLSDSRKGPEAAGDLVERLADLDATLLLVGRWSDRAAETFERLNVVHLGFVKSKEARAKIYSMADLALMMSQRENAPLIVLECLAAGTPVFGYGVGGVRDMVRTGVNGGLAEHGDLDTLERLVREFWAGDRAAISRQAAEAARRDHDFERIAQLYVEAFEAL